MHAHRGLFPSNAISSVCSRLTLVFMFLMVMIFPASSGGFSLKRGINFEVWQTWTNRETFLGAAYDQENYPDWMKVVDDRQLMTLRNEGFDFVRLNVDPSPLFWVGAGGMRRLVDRAVVATRRLQSLGFVVVVDLHLLPEMDGRPDGIHDVLGTGGRQPILFERYLGLISEFAGRLSALPADKTALELVNEPDQDWFSYASLTDRWPTQLAAMVGAARKAAPKLMLVLSGARSGGIEGLLRLDPSRFSKDERITWTFHYYEPMAVTHAGQPWEETPARFLTHLPYPSDMLSSAQADRLLADARRRIDQTITDQTRRKSLMAGVGDALEKYRTSGADPASIGTDFAKVKAWARDNGISPSRILLGEFGVFQDEADPSARLAVLKATREAAEAAGFSWAVYTASLSRAHHSFAVIGDTADLTLEPSVKRVLGLGGP